MANPNRYIFLLRYILPIVDLFTINLSLYLTWLFSGVLGFEILHDFNVNYFIVCNLVWMLSTSYLNMYKGLGKHKLQKIYWATLNSMILHFVLFFLFIAYKGSYLTVTFVIYFYIILFAIFFINRLIGTYFHHLMAHKFSIKKQVALIGCNETSERLIMLFKKDKNIFFHGAIGGDECIYFNIGSDAAVDVSKKLANAASSGVKDIYVTIIPNRMNEVSALLEAADKQGLRLKFVPIQGLQLFRNYHQLFGKETPDYSFKA